MPYRVSKSLLEARSNVVVVEASSVSDYLSRYYKPERMTDTILESYEIDYKCFGYVCTSHYDNVTGQFIAWPRYTPEMETKEAIDKWNQMKDAQARRAYSKNTKNRDTDINLSAFD